MCGSDAWKTLILRSRSRWPESTVGTTRLLRGHQGLAAAIAAIFQTACSASAQPQWTATVFHPAGAFLSEIRALAPGQQAGRVQLTSLPSTSQATIWSGLPASWTGLGSGGVVYGTTGLQQAGFASGFGATLWSGTPQSAVSLMPSVPGLTNAEAYGIAGDQQVGRARINQADHAALWRGSAASFVDLTPPGAQSAIAYATDGIYQWGGAGFLGPNGQYGRALRWNGSPESTLDFTPPGAVFCGVLGVGGGVQVGSATFPGNPGHAVMWQGTPESWMDLHPFPGFGTSILLAAAGSVQAGWSHAPGFSSPHAGVWFGTAESFVDLTQFLPAGFGGESSATSVIIDQGRIIVGGYADGPTGEHRAVIWTRDIPAPAGGGVLAAFLWLSRRSRKSHQCQRADARPDRTAIAEDKLSLMQQDGFAKDDD